MSLAEVQNLLAKLYTDEVLRERFFLEPNAVGAEFSLNDTEIGELTAVAAAELKIFAESLFYKRLREVEKLLPLTKKILGRDFEKHFKHFAPTFTPRTTKKHLADAVAFAAFLAAQKLPAGWFSDLIKFEHARLAFYNEHRRFVFRAFRHDIRQIVKTSESNVSELSNINFAPRKTRALWIRWRGKIGYFVW